MGRSGSRIRWARLYVGYSVNDVAFMLGTTIKEVIAIENGERSPTEKQLKRMADAYGRTEAYLSGDGEEISCVDPISISMIGLDEHDRREVADFLDFLKTRKLRRDEKREEEKRDRT